MPEDVNSGVDDGRGKDRTGFAPRPTVKQAGYGSEEDVTPIRKVHVADVGEAEEDGGNDPTNGFAF